ncbi:glycoside hydrolase [Parafilimonas terrae]|uniref:O-Glycosyl hydrolase n=1 Tax=Parafilimonas terrae TaxID=1465490 RepID=A0A1I5TKU2_9BACT|nr:hypothetical protein [Parafilimonas terrae]SFP83689.1 hypothetical protein SAMN05444277_102186 [Parafilimonas terrae]
MQLNNFKLFNGINMRLYKLLIFVLLICVTFLNKAHAQTEVETWGNLKGMRIQGQLINFESAVEVINSDWSKVNATAKERQHPKFDRQNNKQIITTQLDSFYIAEQFEDISEGVCKATIQFTSKKDTALAGLYFHLKFPLKDYAKNNLQFIGSKPGVKNGETIASGVKVISPEKQAGLDFERPVTIKSIERKKFLHVYIPIQTGSFTNGQTGEISFTIKASGTIDKAPVTVTIDPSKQGRIFAGFGGNFRLQNPKNDPQVIDYCLSNMRVAYGRVEMPWRLWQPDEDSNPVDSAKTGKLNPHVKESMEMAQRLGKLNIPVILSAWFPPQWAVTGKLQLRKQPDEEWGNPLDQNKAQQIYKSIADYVQYLKDAYGVEVKLFSFNESDLGINVRQTGEEHAKLIKELGAYFQSRGLSTKMLLGDNSDATTYSFIYPAMNDAATHQYIGAISFHSWRGWNDTTLQKWADAATKMNLPLFVGEGSIDAAAWAYPKIFEEQTYALEEINLYVRLLNICQPLSILQWQLTSDYSPLKGGGIFGNNDALQPTQRFWNLKQLASVPPNIAAIQVASNKKDITCAAQADAGKNMYVVHLVNNNAARMVTIKGFPASVKKLSVYITNKTKDMQEEKPVAVVNGQATFLLDAVSYAVVKTN